MYFIATTMLTIGAGEVTPGTTSERMLVILIEVIGVMINGYVVGVMVSFLIDPIGSDFLTAFSGLWDYLKFKNIPDSLRSEILNVFQEKWTLYGGAPDPRAVFKFIPETVRDHLKLDITRTCFMKISMMQIATEKLLVAFANVMKPFTACPDEIVITQGEIKPILYLFRSGIIHVYINDSFFAENNCDTGIGIGELELLIDTPREMTVKAVTYVDGWVLSREDLVMTMKHQLELRNELLGICQLVFPDHYKHIRKLFIGMPGAPGAGPPHQQDRRDSRPSDDGFDFMDGKDTS
jgi:hyperpolarization activated cyclic nucleotide-gated potassium channel 2